MRSELLVKLVLLSQAGADPRDLLRAQRRQLTPVADRLARQLRTATGFDRDLARWRHESACATLQFLDALLATAPHHGLRPPTPRQPGEISTLDAC